MHRTRALSIAISVQALKQSEQFQTVLRRSACGRTAHFALHVGLSEPAREIHSVPLEPRIGAVVPKRWARRAVTRNTVKRQIRSVAHLCTDLPPVAYVVRLRSGIDRSLFRSADSASLRRALRSELLQLFGTVSPKARDALQMLSTQDSPPLPQQGPAQP